MNIINRRPLTIAVLTLGMVAATAFGQDADVCPPSYDDCAEVGGARGIQLAGPYPACSTKTGGSGGFDWYDVCCMYQSYTYACHIPPPDGPAEAKSTGTLQYQEARKSCVDTETEDARCAEPGIPV